MAYESIATQAALAVIARHRNNVEDAAEAVKPPPYMQRRVDNMSFGRWLMQVSPQERAQQIARLGKTMPPEQARAKVAGALASAMKAKGMR